MPKLKTLAALAAAVEAGRRYARKNPEQAGKYVDQAASFVDKQTKGKYSGQIHGVVGKVILPEAAGVLVYLLMAAVLLWKPEGLFRLL